MIGKALARRNAKSRRDAVSQGNYYWPGIVLSNNGRWFGPQLPRRRGGRFRLPAAASQHQKKCNDYVKSHLHP
jgi:hypothetical protein